MIAGGLKSTPGSEMPVTSPVKKLKLPELE
jgi:hypothetical protein